MNRRDLLKNAGLLTAAGLVGATGTDALASTVANTKNKLALRIAHITDVHIRPDLEAPQKFKGCLEIIKKQKVDFFLNGGDSIFDASYDDVKRERVTEYGICGMIASKVLKVTTCIAAWATMICGGPHPIKATPCVAKTMW